MSRHTDELESKRFMISKLSFLTVLEALEHEQRANTPMLMGMAFLTAAASAVFAAAYLRIWQTNFLAAETLLSHPLLIAFGVFIFLILVGTSFSVSAQRSELHLAKGKDTDVLSKEHPQSLFFWRMIAQMDEKRWIEYMTSKKEDELVEEASKHLAREAYFISGLVAHKHQLRGWASRCFLVALIAFAVFLGFALNVICGGGAIWASVFGSVVAIVVLWLMRQDLYRFYDTVKRNLPPLLLRLRLRRKQSA